jgi:hypothetical protein
MGKEQRKTYYTPDLMKIGTVNELTKGFVDHISQEETLEETLPPTDLT